MSLNHHSIQEEQLSAYVLDLLSASERQLVEQHLMQCDGCREEIRLDRRIESGVRETMQAFSVPDAQQLHAFMPRMADVEKRRRWGTRSRWGTTNNRIVSWQPLVTAVVLLLVMAGTMMLRVPQRATTAISLTSTSTMTATMTATSVPTATAEHIIPAGDVTPAATPVAASSGLGDSRPIWGPPPKPTIRGKAP